MSKRNKRKMERRLLVRVNDIEKFSQNNGACFVTLSDGVTYKCNTYLDNAKQTKTTRAIKEALTQSKIYISLLLDSTQTYIQQEQ